RVTNAGTTTYSGYFVSVNSSGVWSILRVTNGGVPVTLVTGPTDPLASGDKLGIQIVGSVITAIHWTLNGGWTAVTSYDTAGDSVKYTSAGNLALELKSSTIDDFGGGTIGGGGGGTQPPVNTAPPAISGTPAVGNTLTASNGTWSNSPTSYAYQWFRCDAAGANCTTTITGATSSTYTLVAADQGLQVAVTVTASNSAGPGAGVQSAPSGVVAAGGGGGGVAPTMPVLDAFTGPAGPVASGWTVMKPTSFAR